jgi:hypothetical protein
MNPRLIFLATAAAALVLFFRPDLHACAVCLTGAASDDPTADAYNWSVLFLMAMPYTVVGSIGGWLFYNYRRAGRSGGRRKKHPVLRLAWRQKESG